MADESRYLKQVKTDLSRIKEFLNCKQLIINAHNVDFFTKNLWETCLPKDIRDDLQKLTESEIASLPSKCTQWIERSEELEDPRLNHCNGLSNLFTEIRNHHLKTISYVKKSNYFSGLQEEDSILTSFMMSPKKSYEVCVMSQAVYDLLYKTKATKVVDLGSGKGYLSQYLSLRHSIDVVGIDSRQSNTKNAEKRNEKTLKVWHFLLKKANTKADEERGLTFRGKNNVVEKDGLQAASSLRGSTCLSSAVSRRFVIERENSFVDDDTSNILEESVPVINELSKDENYTFDANGGGKQTELSMICRMSNDIVDDTVPRSKDTPHTSDTFNRNNDLDVNSSNSYSRKSNLFTSYQAITGYISSEVDIIRQLGSLTDKESKDRLVLIGLHTCGDLAPTAIKIFLNDCQVKALCLVGCCYHLLSQPALTETSAKYEDADFGFPVSNHLKKDNFRLSRNATMVAQQAADRLASACKTPSKSILYRAILQVILKEKLGFDTSGMHVGRIGAKCRSFQEYVRKSFQKLGLSSIEITLEEIEFIYQRFEKLEYQIMAFHQLRACIAPCIESLFLIDRLCYLLEQGVVDARIVALFDPVKSPRSYAIIASKNAKM